MFAGGSNKTTKRRGGISLVSSLLFLILFFASIQAESKTISTDPDSTKQKYELNDPRNPDCPCHAAQKQAEEEYKKLQAQNAVNGTKTNDDATNKNKDNPANNATNPSNKNPDNTDVNTNKNSSGTSAGGSSEHYSKSNTSLKQMNKWMRKMKRQMKKKNNGTKKGKRRLASCFHFN
ncbi:MAG TPA: hypothetical protein VFJ43_09620 [Bacteroidia bacterium]|nr:hypothetical protein [Bacteroidia bacterium]